MLKLLRSEKDRIGYGIHICGKVRHSKKLMWCELIKAHGYRIAQVTIDFEDYAWNSAYGRI